MITFEQIHKIEQMTQDDWYKILVNDSKIPNCIVGIKARGICTYDNLLQIVLSVDLEDSEGSICRDKEILVPLYKFK